MVDPFGVFLDQMRKRHGHELEVSYFAGYLELCFVIFWQENFELADC